MKEMRSNIKAPHHKKLKALIHKLKNRITGHTFKASIPTRMPTKSTNIQSFGYDKVRRTLEVEFKNQGGQHSVYRYDNVHPKIHRILMKAHDEVMKKKKPKLTVGKVFYTHVRGRHPYERMD